MLLLTLKQHRKSISRLPSLLNFQGSFALHRSTYSIPDAKAPLPVALLRLGLGVNLDAFESSIASATTASKFYIVSDKVIPESYNRSDQ
ncbi:unnamed protein product [Clonostachys byssicola]|uniref:Uncharacterized protein n=1 Tax=Clonostachys byssicola TaxID=160290 RepID=A0A9N9YBJ2_9HYPO|nr:unnamed protein product [Clonostachys byssicola]